jgi:hypothetical protein
MAAALKHLALKKSRLMAGKARLRQPDRQRRALPRLAAPEHFIGTALACKSKRCKTRRVLRRLKAAQAGGKPRFSASDPAKITNKILIIIFAIRHLKKGGADKEIF